MGEEGRECSGHRKGEEGSRALSQKETGKGKPLCQSRQSQEEGVLQAGVSSGEGAGPGPARAARPHYQQ